MPELSPRQVQVMERLIEAGFRPMAIPPYENALCMIKGDCVAALAPVPNGGLKLLAPPTYLVYGNFSVKLKRGSAEVFVWKKKEIEATAERVRELESFRKELQEILELPQHGSLPLVSAAEKPTRVEALKYYRKAAEHYELELRLFERVIYVDGNHGNFTVVTETEEGTQERYRGKKMAVATGYYDLPNMLGVPGEDLPHVSH